MASKRVKDGPHWVKSWISELSALTDQFRDIETGAVDFEALGREEYHFRMALSRRDFSNSERARKVWEDAVGKYQQRIKAASDKNTEGAANGNNADCSAQRESDVSDSTTAFECLGSARPSTDGDTRKDSRNITGSSNGASLESATSVENPFNEALDSRRGCNTGRAPSVARPGTDKISGISAQKNDQRRAGGISPLSFSPNPPARSGAVDVLNLAYAGEFGNVVLTQEQYAQLGIKFGNQQKLNRAIDSLSCQIENGERNPQNHYAELVKWANYRDDMDERKEEESSKPKLSKMEQSWINTFKAIERM